jgi:hypothetical protein
MGGPAGARENPGEQQGQHRPAYQGSSQSSSFEVRDAPRVSTSVAVRGLPQLEKAARPVHVRGAGAWVPQLRAPEDAGGGSRASS